MKDFLEYTWFSFRLVPIRKNLVTLALYSTVNFAIRLAALYATIRVVTTALEHGGFSFLGFLH